MCHTFLASLQWIFQNPLDAFYMPWYFSCKSHWFCGLVQIHPQDVVVFILNTASPWIIPERLTAPQHTRSILPPIHPTKSIAALRGRYFSLWETYLENFMSRPDVIPTFRQRRCTNRGRNFVRSKRWLPLHEQNHLYLFLRLNNSETFVDEAF